MNRSMNRWWFQVLQSHWSVDPVIQTLLRCGNLNETSKSFRVRKKINLEPTTWILRETPFAQIVLYAVRIPNLAGIVTPLQANKSDFTIGFIVVDLLENEDWFIDFLLTWCFFRRLKSKSRVPTRKLSKQLDYRIPTKIVFLNRSRQSLALL